MEIKFTEIIYAENASKYFLPLAIGTASCQTAVEKQLLNLIQVQ